MDKNYLSTPQVAEILGVSERTVRDWALRGIFPDAIKLSGKSLGAWLFPEAALTSDSVTIALNRAQRYQKTD